MLELTVTDVARICHETNRAYCFALGDFTQREWLYAPQWQKDSAIAGVIGIVSGRITKPSQSHESWLAVKRAEGWMYGPMKDVEHKLHPCFVPYEELSDEQKMKDELFFGTTVRLKPFIKYSISETDSGAF